MNTAAWATNLLSNASFETESSLLLNGNLDTWTGLTNLLADGEMSVWTNSTTLTNWTLQQSGTGGSVNKESTTVKSGKYSARLVKSTGQCYIFQQKVSSGGQKYVFGVWVKSATTVPNSVFIQLNSSMGLPQAFYQNSGDWEYLSVVGTDTDTVLQAYCMITSTANADAYFDKATCYVMNTTAGGLLDNWNWYKGSGTTITIARDEGNVKDGLYSTKITSVTAQGGIAQSISTTADRTKYMVVGGWVKCSTPNVAYIAYVHLGTGTYFLSNYHTGSGKWEYLTGVGLVPNDATMRDIRCTLDTTGVAYFDKVKCYEMITPTGWTSGSGTYTRIEGVPVGTYGARVTTTTLASSFTQNVAATLGIDYWKGRTIILKAWVKASVPGVIGIRIGNGLGVSLAITYHSGSGEWELLTAIGIVDNTATAINCHPYSLNAATADYCGFSVTDSVVAGELLTNSNLDVWAGLVPSNWTLTGTNAGFSQSTELVQDGNYSGRLVRAGTDCSLSQTLSALYYRGNTLGLGCWVNTSIANAVRIRINDNISGDIYSGYHSGSSEWEWLGVSKLVSDTANTITCYLETLSTDAIAYFDGSVVYPGGMRPTTAAADQLVIADGHINNVLVITGGTNYSSGTVVTISAPPAFGANGRLFNHVVQATATPTIVGGVITGITLTNSGAGYSTDVHNNVANPYPTVTITDQGGGSGATAICYVPKGLPQSPSAGSHNASYAIMQNGRAKSWGYNANYKLGQGAAGNDSPLPNYVVYAVQSTGITPTPVRIIESYDTAWILDSLGRVWGVGYNGHYELGLGDTTSRYNFTMIPTSYFGNSPVVKLKESNGQNATCVFALTANGKCYRWGYDNYGQLGTGGTGYLTVPTELTSPTNIVDIAFMGGDGYSGTMLLDTNGYVWVSGYNGYGNLSDGTTTNRTTFQRYLTSAGVGLTGACKIWGGCNNGSYITSYVMCTDGRVYASGYCGANGMLGNNSDANTNAGYATRVLRSDLTNFSADMWWMQRSGFGGSTCSCFARETTTGDIYGWGYNGIGDLGLGDTTIRKTATKITGICPSGGNYVIDIATCHFTNSGSSAVLWSNGVPYTVGYNGYGQLGDGTSGNFYAWIAPSCPQTDIVEVRFSVYDTTSAFEILCSDGTLYISGYNGNRELGNGSTLNRYGLGKVLF